MRYLVTARAMPAQARAPADAIEDGTPGRGSAAGAE